MIGLNWRGYIMKPEDKIENDRIAFVFDESTVIERVDETEDDPTALLDEANLSLVFRTEEEYYEYLKSREGDE